MSTHIPLGRGAEFDRIRALLERFGAQAHGIGDDAAMLQVPDGERLVVSVDASVTDVHFRLAWLTPEEIAWRALHAALSDIAAMGAAPMGVLLAWCVPPALDHVLHALADGTTDAARAAGVPIVGGNLTRGAALTLTTTVLGHAARPVRRDGARPGDRVYVTGAFGGPGAALAAWERGDEPSAVARDRFARPHARLAAGQWLAQHGATAMIDVSDGLAADAEHLATASGVTLELRLAALPVLPGVAPEAALASGEEYELLVTAPPLDAAACEASGRVALTEIGVVREAVAATPVHLVSATRVASPPGHNHFS
ncbi:MAG: thiamine-phosphate kinase [Gemmatimonadaceae bacterium]|jgi:thiamine-monophosphate kinase|nr:thiamine-phosphate kinase [Gemmatimonadaceae bacterium]